MKSKKLNLNDLKIKSFITDLDSAKEATIKGGWGVEPLRSFRCPPTQNGLCTFDACFSKGPGCSDYQVC